jgi:hypothetical protein
MLNTFGPSQGQPTATPQPLQFRGLQPTLAEGRLAVVWQSEPAVLQANAHFPGSTPVPRPAQGENCAIRTLAICHILRHFHPPDLVMKTARQRRAATGSGDEAEADVSESGESHGHRRRSDQLCGVNGCRLHQDHHDRLQTEGTNGSVRSTFDADLAVAVAGSTHLLIKADRVLQSSAGPVAHDAVDRRQGFTIGHAAPETASARTR